MNSVRLSVPVRVDQLQVINPHSYLCEVAIHWENSQIKLEEHTKTAYHSRWNRRGVSRLCACSSKIRVRDRLRAHESWLFSLSSRHISRTQSFQEKSPIKIKDLATLKRFVAVIGRPVPCTARLASRRTQTDRPSTVTLAAHARRGLNRSRRDNDNDNVVLEETATTTTTTTTFSDEEDSNPSLKHFISFRRHVIRKVAWRCIQETLTWLSPPERVYTAELSLLVSNIGFRLSQSEGSITLEWLCEPGTFDLFVCL